MSVRLAKTQISLGIRPVWSESSLSAWKKAWVLSYPLSAQRRLWSDWADAQADLSLRCPHEKSLGTKLPTERTAKVLIRLGGCQGSLGAQSLCWFCHEPAHLNVLYIPDKVFRHFHWYQKFLESYTRGIRRHWSRDLIHMHLHVSTDIMQRQDKICWCHFAHC